MLVHGGSKPLQLQVRNPWILQSLGEVEAAEQPLGMPIP